MRIRDHMDDILEARGYYRKHVARDMDSLFRSVADVLFNTQQHLAQMLKHAYNVRLAYIGEKEDQFAKHDRVRKLADLLGVTFNILETSNPEISVLRIRPRLRHEDNNGNLEEDSSDDYCEDERYPLLACQDCLPTDADADDAMQHRRRHCEDSEDDCHMLHRRRRRRHDVGTDNSTESTICSGRGSSASSKIIFLCFSGNSQYDPVYPKRTIENAAMVQSILYEMLYGEVFNIPDSLHAANIMLNGTFDPRFGKPEIYDKEFEGTALQALDRFLIPFPYKVAKALDPELYRNIEYDVWSNDRRSSPPGSRNNSVQTIGSLDYGTPCLLRDNMYGEVFGFVMQPTLDRRRMEIYVPVLDSCFYVPRNMILPLKNSPLAELVRFNEISSPAAVRMFQTTKVSPLEEEEETPGSSYTTELQEYNISLTTCRDPAWLEKSDFSIPPPRFYAVGPPNPTSTEFLAIAEQLSPKDTPSNFPDPAVMLSVDQNGNYLVGSPSPMSASPTYFFNTIQSQQQMPYPDPTSMMFVQPSFFPQTLQPWQGEEQHNTHVSNYPMTPILTPYSQGSSSSNLPQIFQFPSPPVSPAVINTGLQTFMLGQGGFVYP